jgi:hypothetical protein
MEDIPDKLEKQQNTPDRDENARNENRYSQYSGAGLPNHQRPDGYLGPLPYHDQNVKDSQEGNEKLHHHSIPPAQATRNEIDINMGFVFFGITQTKKDARNAENDADLHDPHRRRPENGPHDDFIGNDESRNRDNNPAYGAEEGTDSIANGIKPSAYFDHVWQHRFFLSDSDYKKGEGEHTLPPLEKRLAQFFTLVQYALTQLPCPCSEHIDDGLICLFPSFSLILRRVNDLHPLAFYQLNR